MISPTWPAGTETSSTSWAPSMPASGAEHSGGTISSRSAVRISVGAVMASRRTGRPPTRASPVMSEFSRTYWQHWRNAGPGNGT